MTEDLWAKYRSIVRSVVEDQLEETDFDVWVGGATTRTGIAVSARQSGAAKKQTISQLLKDGHGRPLLLTAEAGAGKSTMVLQLLLAELDAPDPPVLVQLGSWNGRDPILNLAPGASDGLLESVARGGHLIILDGVDEIRSENLDAPCEAILALCGEFSANQFVITGRSGEIPRWFPAQFRTAEILPLDKSEVEGHLTSLLDLRAGVLSDGVRARLLDLSRNPLVLAMTMRILTEDVNVDDALVSDDGDLASFRSVSSLYQHFLRRIEERDLVKRKVFSEGGDAGQRRAILRRLAWRMLYNNSVFEEKDVLDDWMVEYDEAADQHASVLHDAQLDLVLGRPPLKQISLGGRGIRHGFLHATFRDVYAGEYLLRGGQGGGQPFGIADVVLPSDSANLWPAIVHMAGLARSPSEVADHVIRTAVEFRRQELFVLASDCIAVRWDSSRQSVDDLCLRLLDAFKNWGEAFDFSLIRAAYGLLSRTSAFFPPRLREDLTYFLGKYAPRVPILLPTTRLSVLRNLVVSGNTEDACNAAFTLLHRFDRLDNASVELVLDALMAGTASESQAVRQECLAALQAISRMDSRAALMCRDTFLTFAGPEVPSMQRVYALQGLAKCGQFADYGVIEAALFDHSNPYRDSASWALQRFVHTRGSDVDLVNRALDSYANALRSETNDSAGSYAVGNIVYSIGVLGGVRLRGQVEGIINAGASEYVLEDAVNCLGLLAESGSAPVIAALVVHRDPGVRLKSGEALGRIGGVVAEEAVRNALQVESNEVVHEALVASLASIEVALEQDGTSNDSPIDWVDLGACLARATQRNVNTMRILDVTAEELDVLRDAVSATLGNGAWDREVHLRGAEDRREVILRNTAFHRLVEEARVSV